MQPKNEEMRRELASDAFLAYMRLLSLHAGDKTQAVKDIAGCTGKSEITVRGWQRRGVQGRDNAILMCQLAKLRGFYFGIHMLMPTKAIVSRHVAIENARSGLVA
ncbi:MULTISPECIES: hypothetical protein [Salinivibrio]|uniref:Transcriptional regulator n=1 Tax=Salinivibrio proteolyticus TaxID=334715 RepID=A0ABY7L9X5_9GAMM|nr:MULTISPECIES: hypothetical protein [Salinivibrio]PCE67564.1 hypothetical protein B6G00_04240 [Salinivibrio sp. YCSC6]QCF35531.1 hypothetical protein E8E00_04715 [Salinivibrio sp. YCSC6]WBA13873.1 hypothetical protein N7E60_09035 [Salinivibrio proteolyticus]